MCWVPLGSLFFECRPFSGPPKSLLALVGLISDQALLTTPTGGPAHDHALAGTHHHDHALSRHDHTLQSPALLR